MADISFYKYLEAAFRHKLFKDKTATSFKYLGYNLPYQSSGAEKGIFEYARKVLPSAYTNEFADTQEGNLQMAKAVLEKLDKEGKRLEVYVDPELVKEYELMVADAQNQSQQADTQPPTGEPAGTMGEGTSGLGLPSLGTSAGSYAGRRMIRVVPRAEKVEEPTSKLYVADKSGRVVEERTITPTSVTAKKPEAPSKIYIADKSGNVVGERSLTGETIKSPAQAKLYVANKSGAVVEERTIPRASRFKFPAQIKSIGSKLGVFFQRNLGKFLTVGRIGTLVSTGIGAFAGASFGGVGMFAGGIGGAILSSWIKSGGAGKFFNKVGNGVLNFTPNLSSEAMRSRLSLAGTRKGAWRIILFLVVPFLLLSLGTAFLGAGTPGGGSTGIGNVGIGTTGSSSTTGGSIASCRFTRSRSTNTIKSTTLQGWIVNAANIAGIPPSVLASVTMHENANFVANRDDTDPAIQGNRLCTEGTPFCEQRGQKLHDGACTPTEISTGARTARAIGLMQIVDVFNPGRDLCSITESLAIAASKLRADGITAQPTQEQINQAINRYYNSCTYGSYSYCGEVWTDFQNCQAARAPIGPSRPGVKPAAPIVDPGRLRESIISEFGITMNGFSPQYLQLSWEKFWDISNTNFNRLVRGSVINAVPSGISQQLGCPGQAVAVQLRQYSDQQIFKYALIHELGHVIRNCHGNSANFREDHINAFHRERGVTYYANNARCTGSDNLSEDYAETITRYLFPNLSIQILAAKPERGCNPPPTESVNLQRDFPLHYNVARSILGDY